MDCPNCKQFLEMTKFRIELSAEEDGAEVNLECPQCGKEYFAIIPFADFDLVD